MQVLLALSILLYKWHNHDIEKRILLLITDAIIYIIKDSICARNNSIVLILVHVSNNWLLAFQLVITNSIFIDILKEWIVYKLLVRNACLLKRVLTMLQQVIVSDNQSTMFTNYLIIVSGDHTTI